MRGIIKKAPGRKRHESSELFDSYPELLAHVIEILFQLAGIVYFNA
jgi:hypothetical protein